MHKQKSSHSYILHLKSAVGVLSVGFCPALGSVYFFN